MATKFRSGKGPLRNVMIVGANEHQELSNFQGTFYSFNKILKILLATIVDKKSKKILVKMAGKFSGCLQLFISDLNVENFKSSVKKAREDVKDIVRSTKLPRCNERVIQRKVQIILLQ